MTKPSQNVNVNLPQITCDVWLCRVVDWEFVMVFVSGTAAAAASEKKSLVT